MESIGVCKAFAYLHHGQNRGEVRKCKLRKKRKLNEYMGKFKNLRK